MHAPIFQVERDGSRSTVLTAYWPVGGVLMRGTLYADGIVRSPSGAALDLESRVYATPHAVTAAMVRIGYGRGPASIRAALAGDAGRRANDPAYIPSDKSTGVYRLDMVRLDSRVRDASEQAKATLRKALRAMEVRQRDGYAF